MSSSSSPASAASLIQRLSAKEWNVRLSANEELIALFNDASEGSVGDFAKYAPYLKKIVVDPYPPVKEKAMDALLIFMSKFNFTSVVPANFGGDLAAILIDKCLSARDSIKTKTVEALLLLIENGSVDVVVSELCRVATTHKLPKISSLCVLSLREAVMQFGFGPGCIPPDHILPILEPCFDHPFKDMRTEAFALTVEIYRWMGPSLKPHVKGLRPTQLKELDAAFEMLPPDSSRQAPVRVIKKGSAPTSSPVAVPSTALQQSASNSSINSSPSVQASLANLKNNPKRRSLSIPKAIQLQSPTSATPPSNIPSPYTPGSSPATPSSWSPAHVSSTPPHQGSQIPIRRSLTNLHTNASANSTPSQSPVSTPTSANSTANPNRSSITLSHDDVSLLDPDSEFQVREADLSGDVEEDQQNLPPVDLLSNLSSDWYKTLTDSSAGNTWHTRKAQVDQLINLVPAGSPLKGQTNEYSKLMGCLTRLLSDPNISVQQSVLKAIEILTLGLKADFAIHAKRLAPFLLEKFKEKKTTLVEIVHSLLDLFHQVNCLTIGDVLEPILTTLSSKNPQMKYECLLWLERVIPTTSRQVLLQVASPVCDSFVKCLDDSVVAVRNAASRAFVWLTETLGEQGVKSIMDGLSRQHQAKLKETKEMLAIKKEPTKPTPPSGKPVPSRPAPIRSSSKSLLPLPKPSPIRQSSDYFDDGDLDKSNNASDEETSDTEHTKDEFDRSRSGSIESPFNESNSVFQVLSTMKAEIANFTSKMNANMELFERRLKDKEGRRKEETQFIQEYDKELHSWNEDLQNKNKAIMEELQQEKTLRQDLEVRLAQAEELNTSHASNAVNADAEAQEKFALLDELESVTLEKDDAVSRLEMMTLEKEDALMRLEIERARYSEDANYLSSLEDEELDRMEVEFQRLLQALAKAREIKEEAAES